MRVRRVQFTVRSLMALIACVALLIPIGIWVRDLWYRRAYQLDRGARIGVNERKARMIISMPDIAPTSYVYWSAYADQCARVRQHCERAAARPWSDPGPDPQ
jgi:hypothetical protein